MAGAVGMLLGLAFVEKMGAVMVLLPLLGWLGRRAAGPRVPGRRERTGSTAWSRPGAMLAPLALAFQQIQILQRQFPPPR